MATSLSDVLAATRPGSFSPPQASPNADLARALTAAPSGPVYSPRRREMNDAMLARAMSAQPTGPWSTLGSLANVFVQARKGRKLDEQEAATRQAHSDALVRYLAGKPETQGLYGDPAEPGLTTDALVAALGTPGIDRATFLNEAAALGKMLAPPKRKTLKDAEGYQRYADTGERVFPGVKKDATGGLTKGQVSENARIDAARRYIRGSGLGREELWRMTEKTDPLTGLPNPDYASPLAEAIKRAAKRKHGDDPDQSYWQEYSMGVGAATDRRDAIETETAAAELPESAAPEDEGPGMVDRFGDWVRGLFAEDANAAPTPPASPGAAPASGGGPAVARMAARNAARRTPPAEYPDARWSDREGSWVVERGGKWYAVEGYATP